MAANLMLLCDYSQDFTSNHTHQDMCCTHFLVSVIV